MKFEPQRTARYYYLRFIRLRGKPSELARGIAIGTFIGITPTIPFHVVLALIFSSLLRSSKIAAVLATFVVSNPLTFFPQYYFSWKIGILFTSGEHPWSEVSSLIEAIVHGGNSVETMAALAHIGISSILILVGGGIILAIPFTLIFYFASYRLFNAIREKRIEKRKLG